MNNSIRAGLAIDVNERLNPKDSRNYLGYSCESVANYLIEKAEKDNRIAGLTPMHLNKLVYIMFGFVAALQRKYLFKETIEAWKYGPVIPNLYHSLKTYGANFVDKPLKETDFEEDLEIKIVEPELILKEKDTELYDILEETWERHVNYSAIELMRITHVDGSPWSLCYKEDVYNIEINKDFIRYYYTLLYKQNMKNNTVPSNKQLTT